VVCGYCPCPNSKGAQTAWSQHQNYLLTQNIDRDPRSAFKADLLKEIVKWKAAKDQVLLLIDWNEDVCSPAITQWLQWAGMRDIILEQHGIDAPPTINKPMSTVPIDGIFATPGISASRCGYLPFGERVYKADHRMLWLDLTFNTAFGHGLPPIMSAAARHLKLHCPVTKRRFKRTYRQEADRLGLPDQILWLEQAMTNPPTPEQTAEYEEIDRLNAKAILHADRKCRKLRMGTIPFSPKMQEPMDLLRSTGPMPRGADNQLQGSLPVPQPRQGFHSLPSPPGETLFTERRLINLQYIRARKEAA